MSLISRTPIHRSRSRTRRPRVRWLRHPRPPVVPLPPDPPPPPARSGPPEQRVAGLRLLVAATVAVTGAVVALTPWVPAGTGRFLAFGGGWVLLVWAAAPLFSTAGRDLRRGVVGLELPVATAVIAGLGWAVGALLTQGALTSAGLAPPIDRPQLCSAVVAWVVCLALCGRWVEQRGRAARRAARQRGVTPAQILIAADRLPRVGAGTEQAAARFLLAVLVVAAAASGFWLAASGDGLAASGTAVAVALLAYPVGLGLAAPMLLAHARRRAGDVGVRIDSTGRAAAAAQVDTVVLRRSGTLTTGQPSLVDVVVAEGTTVDETLRLVGALGQRSGNPLGRAIAAAARRRHIPLQPVEVLADRASFGLRAVVEGRTVLVGRERFFTAWAQPVPAALAEARADAAGDGRVTMFAGWDREVQALLVFDDPLRATAVDAAAELVELGVRAVLVSGDDVTAARAVAGAAGISDVVADIGPDETGAIVARYQRHGHRVVTLGHEHDDPELVHADVVIGGSGGRADLWAAVDTIRLSRAVDGLLRQNHRLACGANAIALPLAALGRLTPATALAATTASAVAVVANSTRIRAFRSRRPPAHRGVH